MPGEVGSAAARFQRTKRVALPVSRAATVSNWGNQASTGATPATAAGRIAQCASTVDAANRGAKLARQVAA